MKTAKNSFVLYLDQYPPVQGFSLEQKGMLLDAFFRFNAGETPEFADPMVALAFSFFRQAFERDAEKYARKCAKNAENARRRYGDAPTLFEACGGTRSPADAADSDSESDTDPDNDRSVYTACAPDGAPDASGVSRSGCPPGLAGSSESAAPAARPDAPGRGSEPHGGPPAGSETGRAAAGVSPASGAASVSGASLASGEEDRGARDGGAPGYRTRRKRVLAGRRLAAFNRFWAAFAYPRGKADAADAWLDIPGMDEALVSRIEAAARLEAENRPGLVSTGRTPKMAPGWLSGRRWEDYEPAAGSGAPPGPPGPPSMSLEEFAARSRQGNGAGAGPIAKVI